MLAALAEANLLSDARFAEAYVRRRVAGGYGPLRIRRELHQRGVGSELVRQALAEYDGRWAELAREARRRRFGERAPGGRREQARQARFLEYRGFTAEHIRGVLYDYDAD